MSEMQVNPWISMWTHPRRTVQELVSYKPTYGFYILSVIVGWPAAIQIAQIYNLSEFLSFPVILLITVLASPLLGAIGIVIFSGLLYWTGKSLGGVASFAEVKCATAWSNITGLFSVFIYILLIAYFQGGWFCPSWVNMPVDRYMAYILFTLFVLQVVFFIWTIYLFIQSIAQVQRFSVWKALGSVIMAVLVFWGVLQILS